MVVVEADDVAADVDEFADFVADIELRGDLLGWFVL